VEGAVAKFASSASRVNLVSRVRASAASAVLTTTTRSSRCLAAIRQSASKICARRRFA
jgi:hypothetical protein